MALTHLASIRHEPFDEGKSWPGGGPYELVSGVAHFAVEPEAEANAAITDLDRAERHRVQDGERQEVRFSADFRVLRPTEATGPTNLLFAVANRGRFQAVPFSLDTAWYDPDQTTIEPGDGFLLRHGWTIAWCGWQWDVISGPASLGLAAPEALEIPAAGDPHPPSEGRPIEGRPIEGDVRVDFTSDVPIADHALGDSGPQFSFHSYAAADVDQADAVLTVRDTVDGERRVVDRDRWHFARDEAGAAVTDDAHIRLEGGFEPFRYYEVTYRTRRSPVVGTGLLAVRDFVSFLRYGGPAGEWQPGPGVSAAFGCGNSQSGRFLRHFLHEAMNLDEEGRPVFDGVLPHVAGARLGEFNQRYGQPSHFSHSGIGSIPPFSPAGGLFDKQVKAGAMPRVILTNTSWEYYRGDAALNHIDPTGTADLEERPGVRMYLFAGADHLGPSPVKATMPVANPVNDLNSIILLRAALMNLVAWAVEGIEPPPSRVPRLSDGTAVPPEVAVNAVAIPGVHRPEPVGFPRLSVTDLGPDTDLGLVRLPPKFGGTYPSLVPSVDADGNDTPGIRFPELAAPVATYTGWNARTHAPGLPDALIQFAGSEFPFPATAERARAAGDPRRSLAERYEDREDYARRLRAAVSALVAARHLLSEDAGTALERALDRYDRAVGDRQS
ncbi:MAG: alpha/beta hydrolase domain-containing protein [Acidimicrobiaceae bacterium]|nr:alpha/beta hydrolase domain-containing protein [Acidimicrobiaceae bacterium]